MINSSLTDGVGLVEVDRQERRNALDVAHCEQITAAVGELLRDGARALVVTGAGSAFCSGADLDQVHRAGFREALYTTLHALAGAPVPVIAAVNGPAIGAGTQLAIACDLRVAAPTAQFAVPTARLGLAVDPWTVRRLVHLAGGATARALLLACDRFDAERAHARGLADRLGSVADALDLAVEIVALAPLALRYSKLALAGTEPGPGTAGAGADPVHLLQNGTGSGPGAEDEALLAAYRACWTSEDGVEGRLAAAQRRTATFTGQ